MTIPSDPSEVVRALTRHVRNSHAIGKLVVETALRGISKGRPRSQSSNSGTEATAQQSPAGEPPASVDAYGDLPLPPSEWALLSSGDVVDMIGRCDDSAVRAIGAFEEAHRRRRLVIQAVRGRLEQ